MEAQSTLEKVKILTQNLLDNAIEQDRAFKELMKSGLKGKISTDGESFEVHHLRILKDLIEQL